MIIEISVAIIAAFFIILTIVLVIVLFSLRKTLKNVEKLTHESALLMADIKKKSETLDIVFKPLHALKTHSESKHSKNTSERITEIIECLLQGVVLFNKIKNEVKEL